VAAPPPEEAPQPAASPDEAKTPAGAAAPPPVQEAPRPEPINPNRIYQPRAFGLDWENLFVEGTLYVDRTVAPNQINADGRFATEDVPVMSDEDPWREYTSLDDLRVKAGWTEATMQGFLRHLQTIINRP
jgi:hypothetical protein